MSGLCGCGSKSAAIPEVPSETTPLTSGQTKQDFVDDAAKPEDPESKTSFLESLGIFLKAFIGAGWMSCAFGMSEAHVVPGCVVGILVALFCGFGMDCLAKIWHDVKANSDSPSTISFAQLAETTLGPAGRITLEICLVFAQFGILVAYMVYFGDVGEQFFGANNCPRWAGTVVVFFILVPLCQIREISKLKHTSVIGTAFVFIVIIAATVTCFVTVGKEGIADGVEYLDLGTIEPNHFAEYFGIFFFSMEGITLCMPVVRTMKEPNDSTALIYTTTSISIVFYLLIAVAGYLAYGSAVAAPIFLNMPVNTQMDVLRVLQSLSLIVSVPVQAFPATELLETFCTGIPTTLRLFVVVVPTVLAILMPHMGPILGVVGGFCMTLLGVSLPCTMFLVHFNSQLSWFGLQGKGMIYLVIAFCSVLGFWSAGYSAYLLYHPAK